MKLKHEICILAARAIQIDTLNAVSNSVRFKFPIINNQFRVVTSRYVTLPSETRSCLVYATVLLPLCLFNRGQRTIERIIDNFRVPVISFDLHDREPTRITTGRTHTYIKSHTTNIDTHMVNTRAKSKTTRNKDSAQRFRFDSRSGRHLRDGLISRLPQRYAPLSAYYVWFMYKARSLRAGRISEQRRFKQAGKSSSCFLRRASNICCRHFQSKRPNYSHFQWNKLVIVINGRNYIEFITFKN